MEEDVKCAYANFIIIERRIVSSPLRVSMGNVKSKCDEPSSMHACMRLRCVVSKSH
jgi:hypothetical protein